ncbi:MAG: C69 family dipeptidase [Erysipelotrichaceae bacterium]
MKCKKLTAVLFTSILSFASISTASACTMVYVGKDASEDGSSYVARSEDLNEGKNKIFAVHQGETHAAGEMYQGITKFTMPYPEKTFRYTMVRDDDPTECFAEAGFNENGVAVTATVSTKAKASIVGDKKTNVIGIDPFEKAGITEDDMGSILLSQATSAKHAMELLASIIDQYGAGEGNSLIVSDQKEAWFMEIVSGHQYVAIVLPENKVAVVSNMMMLGDISVYPADKIIKSKDLEKLAVDNNFAVYEDAEKTQFNLAKSYRKELIEKNTYRIWGGANLLNPAYAKTIDPDPLTTTGFEMFFDADRKVNLSDITNVLGYRYEGTAHDANLAQNSLKRAIGCDTQMEIHVQQIRPNMPKELAGIQWQGMANGEYTVYLPNYATLLTDTLENYQISSPSTFHADSMYWNFYQTQKLANQNRSMYGTNIKTFWRSYQQKLIEQQASVDKEMLALYKTDPTKLNAKATAISKAVAKEALGHEKTILSELEAFIAKNPNPTTAFVPSLLGVTPVHPTYSFTMDEEPIVKPATDELKKKDVNTADTTNHGLLFLVISFSGFAISLLALKKRKA